MAVQLGRLLLTSLSRIRLRNHKPFELIATFERKLAQIYLPERLERHCTLEPRCTSTGTVRRDEAGTGGSHQQGRVRVDTLGFWPGLLRSVARRVDCRIVRAFGR